MTDPNTPTKGQRIKEALKGAVNTVNFLQADKRQAIGETLKGASSAAHSWNEKRRETREEKCEAKREKKEKRREAKRGKKEAAQQEKNEQEAKKARIEAILKRGRRRMRNKDVKKRVDDILGRTPEENPNDIDNEDEDDDRAEESDEKGMELFEELIDESGDRETKLYENILLYSCVLKLLHNYHHNKKEGEENTIVEKLNLNLENLHNILSAILGSLRGSVLDKSEILKLIREDEIDVDQILFSEGFGLDEDADKQVLGPKIDKFNEIMSKFGALKKFGNVYQKEGYGSGEVAMAIMSVYKKVMEGESLTKAFGECEDMPDKFDQKKSFDEQTAENVLAEISKVRKAKPNTEEIVASKELEEELEFLTELANALYSKPEVYEADYRNSYFEDKSRVEVIREVNAKVPEGIGTIFYNLGIKGRARPVDVLNEISDKFYGISNRVQLVAKVREIYGAIKNLYPKLKESNPLWIKRKHAELSGDLSL